MLDPRIRALNPWQREVYDLCMATGISSDEIAARLDRLQAERPEEYKKALKVWSEVMLEILN